MTRSSSSDSADEDSRREFRHVLAESEALIPQLKQMVGALNAFTDYLDAVRAGGTSPDGETGE